MLAGRTAVIGTHSPDPNGLVARARDQSALVAVGRYRDHHVQTRGDSVNIGLGKVRVYCRNHSVATRSIDAPHLLQMPVHFTRADEVGQGQLLDRKSTRLNSSHLGISYAVFCLKKKTD